MDETPASLLERLRAPEGQAQAWDQFVRLFTPLIYRVSREAGLQRDDARDVVQEVLLLLLRKLPEFRYDPTRSFRAWLRVVTLNKIRENARGNALVLQAIDDFRGLPGGAHDDPQSLLEETEYRRMLAARALKLMRADFSPTTWQACWEHIVSGQTAAEIGAALGISEGAVYVAKSRVLQRLRTELKGLLD